MTSLAYVAGREVPLVPEQLAGARRRALLIVASGGDPHRDLGLDDRAVASLADDLDAERARAALARGLDSLHRDAEGLTLVQALVEELQAEPDLAWRAFACALLAEELGAQELS